MEKIKVDILCLYAKKTGQTVYLDNLAEELKNLVDLKIIYPNNSYVFSFLNRFNSPLAIKSLPFVVKKRIRKDSIVHIVNQEIFFLIPLIKNPLVVTLHDFGLYTYYLVWKKKEIQLLDKVEKIICGSDSTKKELLKHFPRFEEKAVAVHNSLRKKFKKSTQDLRKKFNLKPTDRIILFVGSDDSKKNFLSLLKAFSELKQDNLILAKVGLPWSFNGNQRKNFAEFILKNNLEEKVKFFDSLPTQDLIDLYFEAEVYVQPSHYEGFGLTLLEAMASGTPVISADNTSLPEVAGNAALFFNSKNEKELKEKLEEILNNKNLQKELIQKGFENVKRFSWKDSAEKVFGVYKKIKRKEKED